jgi:nucleotide-binding universal stress UspA family protein
MGLTDRPVIVTLDGSVNAEIALPVAARLARMLSAPLQVVRVEPGLDQHDPDQRAAEEHQFTAHVRGLLVVYEPSLTEWRARLLDGAVVETILDLSTHARLVVMATHGKGGFKRFFAGSVAERVSRESTVPVLLIPIDGEHRVGDGPVLVAVDGSPDAELGLAVARTLASAMKVGLVILQAWTPFVVATIPPAPPGAIEQLADAAQAYLRTLQLPGEEAVAVAGPPVSAIREAAERLDAALVVTGAHGKGPTARLVLGSTTDALRRTLRRPLLIVHHPPATPLARGVGERDALSA